MLPVLFYGLQRWIWKIMGHIFPLLILIVFQIDEHTNVFHTRQHGLLLLLVVVIFAFCPFVPVPV